MLHLHVQKSQKILSLFVLLAIGLFFAHSEMNFLSEVAQGDHHNHHDYCEVVKEARIEKPGTQNKIESPVALFVHDDCCDVCKGIQDALQNTQVTSTKKFFNTSTFLVNRTLLI